MEWPVPDKLMSGYSYRVKTEWPVTDKLMSGYSYRVKTEWPVLFTASDFCRGAAAASTTAKHLAWTCGWQRAGAASDRPVFDQYLTTVFDRY